MAETNENTSLLSSDQSGTVVDIAVKDVTSANSDSTSFLLHYQAVTDAEGTVPPPNSSIGLNNELFPLAAPPPLHGGNSRGAITNQPVRVRHQIDVEDYEVLLCVFFFCAFCAFILFQPLGIIACIFTGLAYDRTMHHKDPRIFLVLAAITMIFSFVAGIVGIWLLSKYLY
ncbi:uncharacterized protein [Dysidea avara]